MKNICIIPARGSSKRIPKKNIKLFCDKPLIAYSIETALKSNLFEKVIVSTDSEEIAEVAKKYGAEVPFMRPKELSDDYSTSGEAVNHAIEFLKNRGEEFCYVCTIYATAPFLQVEYLKQGFEALQNSDAKMAFSVTSMPFPIQRTFKITPDGRCQMFTPEYFSSRSQDLEEAYQDAGQFYWVDTTKEWKDIAFGSQSIPIVLPRYLVQDIDTMEDFKRAELMYKAVFPNEFDKWSELKQKIEQKEPINFNERDILFISIGQNIGLEQYGKSEEFLRPVVVLKKYNRYLFLGIPLSSKIKKGYFFHTMQFKNRINSALLLQSRTFDSKRVKYRLSTLSQKQFDLLKKRYCEVITPFPEYGKGSD